jgi:hypothetical protein
MAIFERFYSYEVVSECGKNISACTENTLKEFKHIRRKRQEGSAYIENTPIDIKLSLSRRIFDENQQNGRSKTISVDMIECGKKPSHATVPLNYVDITDSIRVEVFNP